MEQASVGPAGRSCGVVVGGTGGRDEDDRAARLVDPIPGIRQPQEPRGRPEAAGHAAGGVGVVQAEGDLAEEALPVLGCNSIEY